MATLLVIDSSPRSASASNTMTLEFVEQWKSRNAGGKVIHHNVANEDIPYVTEPWIAAVYTPREKRSAQQNSLLALSDKLIAELIEADTILIGSPMWNFGIAAPLKAWVDQIVRAGLTFSYGEAGPKGLLDSKKRVIVAAARGGTYSGDSPVGFLDQQTPYLKLILGFIGLTDVSFVYAENQSRGGDDAAAGLRTGRERIEALV